VNSKRMHHDRHIDHAFKQRQVAFIDQGRLYRALIGPAENPHPRHHEGDLDFGRRHAVGEIGHGIAEPHHLGALQPGKTGPQAVGERPPGGVAEPARVEFA
jgi:hypothetical protein